MPWTTTSGTSIRLPNEDALAGTNLRHHWECDEASLDLLDTGLESARDQDMKFNKATVAFQQTLMSGVGVQTSGSGGGVVGATDQWGIGDWLYDSQFAGAGQLDEITLDSTQSGFLKLIHVTGIFVR